MGTARRKRFWLPPAWFVGSVLGVLMVRACSADATPLPCYASFDATDVLAWLCANGLVEVSESLREAGDE